MFEDADKFLKIAVGLGILAAGLGVGYHYGIYVPQHEREQIAAAENSRIERAASAKAAYDECLGNAASTYSSNWDADCKINGTDKKTAGCALPMHIKHKRDKYYADDKATCAEIYKTQLR